MRSLVPSYEIVAPPTLAIALERMAVEPGVWKPFAGGTDIMVLFEAGTLKHNRFLSIWGLDELHGIEESSDTIKIGALTTYSEIRSSRIIQDEFPMLVSAAKETGGLAIQNRGTLGGNIVNASPAADSPPALMVYEAELELISTSGSRRIPYTRFHAGYKQMDLRPDELLKSIVIPRSLGGWRQYYRKVGTRKAQAISKICLAAAAKVQDNRIHDIRLAFGSVAPMVVRCPNIESLLNSTIPGETPSDSVRKALSLDITPIDDIRSNAKYRMRVAGNVLEEFLRSLSEPDSKSPGPSS